MANDKLFSNVSSLFGSHAFVIPDYQRDYSWTAQECDTLLNDIFATMEDENPNKTHFLGTIVTVPYNAEDSTNNPVPLNKFNEIEGDKLVNVVDGQQRLTSICLLARAVFKCMQKDYRDKYFKDGWYNHWSNQLKDLFQCKNVQDKEYKYNLPTMMLSGNTGKCYIEQIQSDIENYPKEGITVDGKKKGAKNLINNAKVFADGIEKKIKELDKDHESFYEKLCQVLLYKVNFVEINCSENDAFQIFDSLNGKGMDLTAADRIKNILLSWDPEKGEARAQKWDEITDSIDEGMLVDFFSCILFDKCEKRIAKKDITTRFKKEYENDWKNFRHFFSELKRKAELYGKLTKPKYFKNELNTDFYEALLDFENIGVTQVYVMLHAAIYHLNIDISHRSNDLMDFTRALTSLIVRHQVCSQSMNRLDHYFSGWLKDLHSGTPLPEITKKIRETTKIAIDDETFRRSFAQYAPKNNKNSTFYLRHLESQMRIDRAHDSNPLPEVLSVEHVIPQRINRLKWAGVNSEYDLPEYLKKEREDDFKDLIEMLGNKALLKTVDNSAASNLDFQTKKEVYRNSAKTNQNGGTPQGTFQMIQEIIDYDHFTDIEVKKRSKEMADIALKIW